jgi:hypothetical protein
MVIHYLMLSDKGLLMNLVKLHFDELALVGKKELGNWRIVIHRPLYRALYRVHTLAQRVMGTEAVSGRAG